MKDISITIIVIIAFIGCETIAIDCNVSEYNAYSEITIQKCEMKVIRENTFVNRSISYLILKEDGIETIQPGAFKNLTKLRILKLDYNNLKLIQAGTFTKLPITLLSLSDNSIDTIEDLALSDLPNLKHLFLENNKIENITISKIMDDPSGLVTLRLTNNSLTALTIDMLKGLTNVKHLRINSNKISTIEQGTFEQTPKLNKLNLSNNKIKEVDGSIFPRRGLPSLRNIYLNNNELMYLPADFFLRLDNLDDISLVGNPWLCPCLDVISRILHDKSIEDSCLLAFKNARGPACIIEPSEPNCSYKYNNQLSARYFENMKSVMNSSYKLCKM